MRSAVVGMAGLFALCCATLPARADDGLASLSGAQVASDTILVFSQVSSTANRLATEHAADARLRRFAATEAAAEASAIARLKLLADAEVAANDLPAANASDAVRTGRSVSTDSGWVVAPAFPYDLPAVAFGLAQLSAERDGAFDGSYRTFEAAVLQRLSAAFVSLEQAGSEPSVRALAGNEAARLGRALASLRSL